MALGATRAETTWHIVVPYALPDICSSVILSISRVIGETMIVLMAAGVTASFTFNPLHSVTTITVQIATILTGTRISKVFILPQLMRLGLRYSLSLGCSICWLLSLLEKLAYPPVRNAQECSCTST
ncbi:binding--dependent transport system inner membrane component family protein [Anaplasma phagocytophilum str. ApNP]|uniref:Binding--dependent transport system inner membrane component family protein n=1 Tax=Anaplasma phagocytophilum str. ApNP TaxID=1359153 RepID=A0A0F3NHU9_ANAPH|nr:binding--dependent transport system inner membrane component family protein [Anaplasma phagocytophilum str. ApNP]